ncbi:hypothetical protein DSOUD_1437 [Desulfuromonas soudanensis]|uniref:Ig-like domain-containing protein n=1 Tax=Desulfuromonas soudanensis TaxID=1603606 RepID=A0A0M4CWA3_9BACT|nr:hypothetical protein [Desulfuromonas soudanensis]ALC16216.1 hypothetical protein DSOUD_1437 [Desulfuromonas soudanensis]
MKKKVMNTKFGIVWISVLLVLAVLTACGDDGSTPPGQPAAVITTQPVDQSVVAGTTATFTVAASNAAGYQWQISTDSGLTFSDIGSATAASYTTAATAVADSGTQYRVVVSGLNSVTSSAVTLTVTAAPVPPGISVQPADQTISDGQDATFTVTATGTSLTYQWQRSVDGGSTFAEIAAAINATLNLTAVPSGDNGHQFQVVVSNSTGSITSNAATLTVNSAPTAPVFTTHPASVSITEGQNTQFTVVVSGTPTPTLQWQLSTDSGSSWNDIVGQTDTIFNVVAPALANNGRQFRAVATNSAGTVNSNAATLTVTGDAVVPAFTTHPADVAILEGQNAQFTVVVTGTPTPTLQWQLSTDGGANWNNINGETGTSYTAVQPSQANNGRQFRVVATNSAGVVNSSAAVLTVTAVVASGWQGNPTPLNLDATAALPALAANGGGEAIALWTQYDGIFASRYLPQSGWQARVAVSEVTAAYGFTDPTVAMNGNGQAVALWRETDNAFYHRVRAAIFAPAGGWGGAATLSVNDTTGGSLPQVAVDASGNALAVWIERESLFAPWKLMVSRFIAGSGTWEPAQRLDSDAIGEPSNSAAVAMNGAGEAMVLWPAPSGTPGTDALWVRRLAANGSWGAAQLLDPAASGPPEQRIAMDVNGNAMAVWKKFDNPSFSSIWSIRFDSVSGSWGTAVAVESSNVNRATAPQIAFDANGEAVAVWVQFDGTQELILSNRHTGAGGWGTQQQVAAGAINQLTAPSLAVNAGGTAVVAWRDSNFYVAASIQSPGAAWRTPQRAPITGADGLGFAVSGRATAGIDDSANATVIWPANPAGLPQRIYGGQYR